MTDDHKIDLFSKAILSLIKDKHINPLPPHELNQFEDFVAFYVAIVEIREAICSLKNGELDYQIKGKGYLSAVVKALQASMKHIAWHTKAISNGDFSQKIDFMGELADVFNQMTKQVEINFNKIANLEIEAREAKEHFEQIFSTSPDPTLIVRLNDRKIVNANNSFYSITGYSKEETINKNVLKILTFEHLDVKLKLFKDLKKNHSCENVEVNFIGSINQTITTLISAKIITLNSEPHLIIVARDISRRKLAEAALDESRNALKASEEQLSLLISQMQQGLAVHEIICDSNERPIDYRYLKVNTSYEKLTGNKAQDIIGKTALEISPRIEQKLIEIYGKVAMTGAPFEFEKFDTELNKHFSVSAYSPKKNQFAIILEDITEKKITEAEIEFLSFHDQLTGLYNLRFYEQEIQKLNNDENALPLTLIMADLNGLKLSNDAFGHRAGDILLQNIAKIFKKACRDSDIISRVGGDEFVLLLPNTSEHQANELIRRIEKSVNSTVLENAILSVSLGHAVKNDIFSDINEIFKEAEDKMYRQKLSESTRMRRKTIQLIRSTFFSKNKYEHEHSKNVSRICGELATAINLPQDDINKIKIAGLLHDIGKIGIDSSILIKPGKLTYDEWIEVKRHAEVGYRILNSVDEYSDVARFVLEHHERWDGKGYPKGIKGDTLLLQSRILALVDAYDTMMMEKPYKQPVSKEQACKEIIAGSGTQFDPKLVEIFIEEVVDKI